MLSQVFLSSKYFTKSVLLLIPRRRRAIFWGNSHKGESGEGGRAPFKYAGK
jgi:hypothetical protein